MHYVGESDTTLRLLSTDHILPSERPSHPEDTSDVFKAVLQCIRRALHVLSSLYLLIHFTKRV